MSFHPPTDAPHFTDIGIAQHPVAFGRIADVDHAAGMRLQAFRGVVGELGQRFRGGDADADRDAGALINGRANGSAKTCQVPRNAAEIGERLINLKERLWAMDIATGQSWSVFAINPRCPYFSSIFPRKNESVSIRHCMDPTVYLLHSAKTPELNACQ